MSTKSNMTEDDVEFSDSSEKVEVKAEPAEWFFQLNIPVVPLWAIGSMKCNSCDFRTKYESVLRDHRKLKHTSGYQAHNNKPLPVLEQENASCIEKYSLKCGLCGFTSKYKAIFDNHINKEQHEIANDFSNNQNHLVLKQENTITLPAWAMGNLKCGQCSFRAKYKTILDYHLKKEKHMTLTYSHKSPHRTKIKQHKAIYKGKSVSSIIIKAIQRSKGKKTTLKNIYSYFDDHFPSNEKVKKATQNTIRHTLSINKKFHQIEKGYWEVNPGGGTGKGSNVATVETKTWY